MSSNGREEGVEGIKTMAKALKEEILTAEQAGRKIQDNMPREVDTKGTVRVFSFKVRPRGAETHRQQVCWAQMDVFEFPKKDMSDVASWQEAIAHRIGRAHWYKRHVAYLVLSPGMSFTVNYD